MPWKETSAMNERQLFIEAWLASGEKVQRLCRRFNISPKTSYKWINRFKAEGFAGPERAKPALRLHTVAALLYSMSTF